MIGPVMWTCNALLVNQPGGYGQMALFDAAYQWCAAIQFIPVMIGQIVLPILSNLNGRDENDKFRKVLHLNMFLNGGIALVVGIPVILMAPLIMQSYGAGFDRGASVLTVLSISTVLVTFNNVIGQAIASKGKMWTGLFMNSLWAATLLLCGFITIRLGYGAIGLALANLIAYICHSIWQFAYAAEKLGLGVARAAT